MEKANENKISEYPIKEMKYSQSVEEMKQLIPFLKDEMKQCPSENLSFNLVETIDYYSLIRNFKIKSSSPKDRNDSINKFNDSFLTNISSMESFTVIPSINYFEIVKPSNKGNMFKPPKIYDINGDEINLGGKQTIIFLYDNLPDLNYFISRNKNINYTIYCLGVNMNFFSAKKWVKNNGLLNNGVFNFCFTEISAKGVNTATNLRINNLPRVAIIGTDGIISEDKCIRNVNIFDLHNDFISKIGQKGEFNSEEQAKIDKFIYLENDNKRNVVKSMNIYLKNNGLNDVHFYVKSKISIDKRGIKKSRCYPVFYGEAKKETKNLIDNLITILNGQQLFHEIQCKVKYV